MYLKSSLQLILIALITLMGSLSLNAQEMVWEKDLKSILYQVSWIEQSNDGIIIAAGDKGMVGLDNNTGSILWQKEDLKAIDRNTFHLVEGLPIFHIESSTILGKTRSLLIHSTTGAILFDTKEENMKIGKHHILPQISSILFETKQEATNKLLLFNYETAKVTWVCDLGAADGGLKSLVKKSMGLLGFLQFAPNLMDDTKMLVGEGKKITVLDYTTGKVLWSTAFKKRLKAIAYSSINENIYVGIKEKLQVFDSASGKDVTNGKMKLGGSLEKIFPNSDNNIVVVDSKGFNIIDPTTGKFLWKKSFGIDGLYDVQEIDGHYLAIGSGEKSSAVAKVTKEGKKIWREKLDGYAYYVQPIEKGVFYLSTEKSNILNYAEGKKVWKKDIKFKAIPAVAVDKKNGEVLFYEGKELYRFNLSSGSIETVAEGIKFEKGKKAVFELEVRPNGYFLHASQHTAFFDKKGKMVYNNYYNPVSTTDFTQIIQLGVAVAGVDIDIAGSLETIKSLDALSHGALRSVGDQNEATSSQSVLAGLYSDNVALFEVTKTRFFNSKSVKNHKYLLTNSNGSNQIIMVHKDSGEIYKKVALTDKTPSYVTDEIDQRIFLNENNHKITCYQMNGIVGY